jgi:flagellar protein FlaF
MSNAAQAYSRTSHTTASPREIEAQALLKAARQLLDVQANWAGPDKNMHNALLFNRRLWSIFMSAMETNDNQQPLEVRQNIANIGVFVMKQTIDMQLNPDPAKLNSLIDINCNLAAGLSGKPCRLARQALRSVARAGAGAPLVRSRVWK